MPLDSGSLILSVGLRCKSPSGNLVSVQERPSRYSGTTYHTHQTLRVLIHGTVFGELKLVLQYPVVNVRMVICPESRSPEGVVSVSISGSIIKCLTIPPRIS